MCFHDMFFGGMWKTGLSIAPRKNTLGWEATRLMLNAPLNCNRRLTKMFPCYLWMNGIFSMKLTRQSYCILLLYSAFSPIQFSITSRVQENDLVPHFIWFLYLIMVQIPTDWVQENHFSIEVSDKMPCCLSGSTRILGMCLFICIHLLLVYFMFCINMLSYSLHPFPSFLNIWDNNFKV